MLEFRCSVVCVILTISVIEASRILVVVRTPSISHQIVFRPLTQALAKRGHEVTVITTDPAFPKGGAPTNLTEIDIHDISYGLYQAETVGELRRNPEPDLLSQMSGMVEGFNYMLQIQLSDKNIQDLINDKSKQFDLLILEAYMRSNLGFSHIYKVPVIQMSSFGGTPANFAAVGAPLHPLIFPTSFQDKLNNLTMLEKIHQFYTHYKIQKMLDDNEETETNLLRKFFGEDVPPVNELFKNVHMLFLNVHPLYEGIRPVPPAVVYTGGLHQTPSKDLPTDLKSYLDSSKNGVIYVSFGTNIEPSLLPPEKLQVLISVFSQQPYDILWKWGTEELPGRPANMRISKWLPQADLLKHPKIKLFVTQGGLQSTDEAITAGVPMVGVPMLGDQWFNVEKYVQHKIGVGVDIRTITEEKLKNAINTVIGDDSYRQSIERLRSLIYDQPQSSLDRAVWWVEYVLRHGGAKHLHSPTANMSWWQFLELPLVLTLISAVVVVLLAIILTLRLIYTYLSTNHICTAKEKRS